MLSDGTNSTVDFALHTITGGRWVQVQSHPDGTILAALAQRLVGEGEAEGVRVVRRVTYPDFDCVTWRYLFRWVRGGTTEPDPSFPVLEQGRPVAPCASHDDFVTDEARAHIFPHVAKYLEENRLTLLELLHVESSADLALNAGALVQTTVQRIAAVQCAGTQKSVATRVKELDILLTGRMRKLREASQSGAPFPFRPGKFGEQIAAIEEKHGSDSLFHTYRAFAHYLAGSRSWGEKVERLFELYEPDLEPRHARAFDRLGAEMLTHASTVRDVLVVAGRRRVDRVIAHADLLAGRFAKPLDLLPIGLRAMGKLLTEGSIPRCRAALFDRFVRDIGARVNLGNENSLYDEFEVMNHLIDHLKTRHPALHKEPVVADTIQDRVDRMSHHDRIAEYLAGVKGVGERLDRLLGLGAIAPLPLCRQRIAVHMRSLMKAEDLVREYVQPHKDKASAIPVLAKLGDRIVQVGFEPPAEAYLLGILDTILVDVLKTDVLKARISPLERMQKLIRLCTLPPLPPGRARKIVAEAIAAGMASPEFEKSYVERFPAPQDRDQALGKLKDILRNAGLLAA
jgi:hypothetical protein